MDVHYPSTIADVRLCKSIQHVACDDDLDEPFNVVVFCKPLETLRGCNDLRCLVIIAALQNRVHYHQPFTYTTEVTPTIVHL